jgi:hypothetical protein
MTTVRSEMSRWKWFLLNQKYRFDLGHQFFVFLNFTLLVIAASDKLRYYTHIPRTWILVLAAVPVGFFCVWLFGFFLDKVVRYSEAYNQLATQRNPHANEQNDRLKRIEALLEELRSEELRRK